MLTLFGAYDVGGIASTARGSAELWCVSLLPTSAVFKERGLSTLKINTRFVFSFLAASGSSEQIAMSFIVFGFEVGSSYEARCGLLCLFFDANDCNVCASTNTGAHRVSLP